MSDQKEEILMIDDGAGRKIKKIVLDEDTFVGHLDRIVERDYFPDLKKLKTNLQLFNQLPESTPAEQTPANFDKPADEANEKKIDENASLGQFLSKYTSEDNASFSEIIQATNKRHQEKFPWFYLDEEEVRLQIEESMKLPAIDAPPTSGKVITWPYRNKNSMMFNPDGLPISAKDQIEESAKNKQQIVIENTRFRKRPFRRTVFRPNTNQTDTSAGSSEASEATGGGARSFVQSKYDANGELINLERKEYKLVDSTPLIEPSDMASPLMTWGEIESTPLLIDSEEFDGAPSSGRFKIPEMPVREQVALKLTDSFSKAKKQQSNSNSQSSSRRWNSSPFPNSPRTPRLDQLSPAVQQFAQDKLNLRLNIKNDYKNISSSFLHNKTPSPYVRSLRNVRSSEKRSAPSEATSESGSTLTDNLLKLSSKDD